jgi:hypothetical protein
VPLPSNDEGGDTHIDTQQGNLIYPIFLIGLKTFDINEIRFYWQRPPNFDCPTEVLNPDI